MTRLLLIGGGHAHVHVLEALAKSPIPGTEVTLLSPTPRQIYSGMLPGWIAGHYQLDDCTINLDHLCAHARIPFRQAVCCGLDLARRCARLDSGEELSFDLASLDCGAQPSALALPGARQHALSVRPIESFIAAVPQLIAAANEPAFRLAIGGAGAAGCELALAFATRFGEHTPDRPRITLIGSSPLPLPGFPRRLRQQMATTLQRRGIEYRAGARIAAIAAGQITLNDGDTLHASAVLLALGAGAAAWPAASGLDCDPNGFVCVDRSLRSTSHSFIFAAGDMAAYADPRPKSGVYAVRAGPVLADNLRAACSGSPQRSWTPQTRALYLISTGDGRALACRGALAFGGECDWLGRKLWSWKDHIDRSFMRRFAAPAIPVHCKETEHD